MFFKKRFGYVLNLSAFAGILPLGASSVILNTNLIGNKQNKENSENSTRAYNETELKFAIDGLVYYISPRTNPMNNFVSLTTNNVGNGSIEEQFTYVLCDTSTIPGAIQYAKNTGVAKLDYSGNVKDLWILPKSKADQENDNLYTTNIVFGDTEDTIYVLVGIRNPAKELNIVYNGFTRTKIIWDPRTVVDEVTKPQWDGFVGNVAYFSRNSFRHDGSFERNDNYLVYNNTNNGNIYASRPIKIFKLNANNFLEDAVTYSFHFPPYDAQGGYGGIAAARSTILAGFNFKQLLNYWDVWAPLVDKYYVYGNSNGVSLMNSSFFHYLQYGQVFDYLGNDQFLMVPKYIGIDPNIGGLYSLVSSLTKSVASLSSYVSLYHELFRYKGQPKLSGIYSVDFNNNLAGEPLNYQYQYLDGSGNIVDVTSDSEFALNEGAVNLILSSIGYFLGGSIKNGFLWNSTKSEEFGGWGVNMSKANNSVPGWMLGNYGVICFSPNETAIVKKYKLYLFNRYKYFNKSSPTGDNFNIKLPHFVIDNMLVQKDENGKKRYEFILKMPYTKKDKANDFRDYYNADVRNIILYGTHDLNDQETKIGFTWEEFSNTYLPIRQSQDSVKSSSGSAIFPEISLSGVVNVVHDAWYSEESTIKNYIGYFDSIYSSKVYDNNNAVMGYGSTVDVWQSSINDELTSLSESSILKKYNAKSDYDGFASSSGSKYIIYGNNVIMSDPVWSNKLVVFDGSDYATSMTSSNYNSSYRYSSDPYSLETFNRISNLFLLPNNTGFGYLTYKNEIYISLTKYFELQNRQLNEQDFIKVSLNKNNSTSTSCSIVPVGKTVYVSAVDKDGHVSSTSFPLQDLVNNTDNDIWIIAGMAVITLLIILVVIGIFRHIAKANNKNKKLQLNANTRVYTGNGVGFGHNVPALPNNSSYRLPYRPSLPSSSRTSYPVLYSSYNQSNNQPRLPVSNGSYPYPTTPNNPSYYPSYPALTQYRSQNSPVRSRR